MKNIPYFDILFIIISACIFFLITYLGYTKLLSQYSVIVALIAYFVGKYIGKIELRKKLKENKS